MKTPENLRFSSVFSGYKIGLPCSSFFLFFKQRLYQTSKWKLRQGQISGEFLCGRNYFNLSLLPWSIGRDHTPTIIKWQTIPLQRLPYPQLIIITCRFYLYHHNTLETSCLATAIFILSLLFKFTIQATATVGAAQKKHWIGSAKMCD